MIRRITNFIASIGIFAIIICHNVIAQSTSSSVSGNINAKQKYLFYLHGGVVTGRGDSAVNQSRPEWGPYEYRNILDSLSNRGFNVISEIRSEEIADSLYARKIALQVDTLLASGIAEENIIAIGASAGADIVLQVAAMKKNSRLHFVIMGACWPDTYKHYERIKLYGHILSIVEKSDPHGTCTAIFHNRREVKSFEEITINTGLSHGFLYKGYASWIDPILSWLKHTHSNK